MLESNVSHSNAKLTVFIMRVLLELFNMSNADKIFAELHEQDQREVQRERENLLAEIREEMH